MNLSISRGIWEIIGIEMRVLLNFSESGWGGDLTQLLQPASAVTELGDFDIHPIKQGNP